MFTFFRPVGQGLQYLLQELRPGQVGRKGGWRSRVAEPARARGAGVDAGLDAVALVAELSRADGPLPADAGAVAGGGDWESEAHLAGTPLSQRAAARERLGRSIILDAASTYSTIQHFLSM